MSTFVATVSAAGAVRAAERPNIVIIYCDDLGYADIGCFGAKGYTTPHIDQLARDGRRFTNFYVASPVCSASRAALLTGCYPGRVGIHGALGPNSTIGLNPSETTLAELLQSKGYATAIVGKWHLGDRPALLPTKHGFDHWLGLPYSNDMWPYHPTARRGAYPPLPLFEDERVVDADVLPADQEELPRRYADRAVEFIRAERDGPFFLYFAPSMPHVPLFAGEEFRGTTERGLYGDVIREIDWSVGEIVKALEQEGLCDNTLVIFTSDNGPWLAYGEHSGVALPLREGKGTCWEGGVRVPCVMRWPGNLPAGSMCNEMLMTIDLLPTLAHVVGAELPTQKIDGRNVWPLLAGEPGATNPHEGFAFWYLDNELNSVISGDGRWKLVLPHTYRTLAGQPGGKGGLPVKYEHRRVRQPELYDLADDVGETTDVAVQHPDVVARLSAFADQARDELGDSLTRHAGRENRPPGRVSD